MSKIVNVRLLHTFITSCTELLKFVSIGLSAEAGMRKTVEAVMQVEDDQDIWPSIKDWKIDNLTASFSEKLNDKIALGFCLKWNKVMMWVMLLRFQCGLRGVKPSELIDSTYYDSMLLISSLSDTAATYDPQLSYEV